MQGAYFEVPFVVVNGTMYHIWNSKVDKAKTIYVAAKAGIQNINDWLNLLLIPAANEAGREDSN